MADVIEIKAAARPRAGKGAARAVRREGLVPAVIYGEKKEAETIALDANELWKIIQKGRFLSTVFDINVDGNKRRVLPREIQLDPVKDTPVHVDFQRVGDSATVRVIIPVQFINDGLSPGLKRGGVLNIVRHEVEVTCPPNSIPHHFTVDLEGVEIGRSIHISSIDLGEGVQPTILDRDFTVATIAGKKTDDDKAAEGAEGGDAKAAAAPAAKGAPAAKAAAPAAKPAAKK